MKLASPKQPPRNVGGLESGTLGRRVSRQVAGNRYENVPALVGVAPLTELTDPGFQHLIAVEACIFPEKSACQSGHDVLCRVAQTEMTRHQPTSGIDLTLPIERIEQGGPDLFLRDRKIIQSFVVFAGQPCCRDVQIAREVNGHHTVENAADGLRRLAPPTARQLRSA